MNRRILGWGILHAVLWCLVGAATTWVVAQSKRTTDRGPGAAVERISELLEELDLSPEQRDRLDEILDEYRTSVVEADRQADQQFWALADAAGLQADSAIESLFTEEQRREYHSMVNTPRR